MLIAVPQNDEDHCVARTSTPTEEGALTPDDFYERAGAHDDRRCEPRVACDKVIGVQSCRAGDDGCFRPARVLDCSVHGLGLLARERMDVGEQFMVQFKLDRVILAVYDVRHCRRAGDRFIVGASLHGFIGGPGEPDAAAVMRALTEAGRVKPAAE